VCAQHAITFKTDHEGFWYPEVDMQKCTDCHLCEKVCPIINIQDIKKNDFDHPSHTYAAIHRDMSVRWDSTSGGAFSALADVMYRKAAMFLVLYIMKISVSAISSATILLILIACAVLNIYRAKLKDYMQKSGTC
jgi:NAD-dependent dihydropyrimidine dehydrogenase PreA subunit